MTLAPAMSHVGELAHEGVKRRAISVPEGEPCVGELAVVAPEHLDSDRLIDSHVPPPRPEPSPEP